MTDKQTYEKKFWTKTIKILIYAFISGILLIVWSANIHEIGWLKELTLGLGIAGITAGILGFAVDRVLAKDLADEAVQHTLGYHFPEGLRGEVQRLYELHFLVIEHKSVYDIQVNPDDHTVTVHLTITRKHLNFTNSPQDIHITYSADQNTDRGTVIEEISYWLKDEDESHYCTDIKSTQKEVEGALEYKGKKISIPKNSWIEITAKHQETKLKNDVIFTVLPTPTVEPILIVRCDEKLEYRKGYTHRNGELGVKDKLLGTLLPSQAEYVRWWPKGRLVT